MTAASCSKIAKGIGRTIFRPLFVGTALVSLLTLAHLTRSALLPLPSALPPPGEILSRLEVYDRGGRPLSRTYLNNWNYHHNLPLSQVPELVKTAFIISEDKRFYEHGGVDWLARISAIGLNLRHLRNKRGASTITEQVVRMLHPRPRTIWSRWLETFEAMALERNFSKGEIFEFYLNQVPYSNNRRGIIDAAHYYFGRDLSTLSGQEILSLATLVRAPSVFNPHKQPDFLQQPVANLRARLKRQGLESFGDETTNQKLHIATHDEVIPAPHFTRYVRDNAPLEPEQTKLVTTLDADLQLFAQSLLDRQLKRLSPRRVTNGAMLVLDHRSDEILAWVSLANSPKAVNEVSQSDGADYDAVLARRQPGSAIKPFLYALALEKGWSPATTIEDSPLEQAVGTGMHRYRNYSGHFYGPVRLREALGSSLNTPAVRAALEVGLENLLGRLKLLGLRSLDQSADFYGPGLALGSGEVSLFEMVRAYASLANQGVYREPRLLLNGGAGRNSIQVFTPEVTSLISNILSDPQARALEFGRAGVLEFPFPVAAKTGTSNDFRDAWAFGYSSAFTVGVWMGNLSGQAMQEVNGSSGPGLVLRGIFSELSKREKPQPLPLSPSLRKSQICSDSGLPPDGKCPVMDEWFVPGTEPKLDTYPTPTVVLAHPRIKKPVDNLILALDPRIPDELEKYELQIDYQPEVDSGRVKPNRSSNTQVHWLLNSKEEAITTAGKYLWPVKRGSHTVQALIATGELGKGYMKTEIHSFTVK